jgi:UDP-N-acetylglucosamine acyltransferase
MSIHPTAIVSPKAELDPTVEVGPNVIIEDSVRIGANTSILANAFIGRYSEIGRDNRIHIGAVLGHEPQDVKFDRTCRSYLRIGDRNIFREYCTVHRGSAPESATVIGDDSFLMVGSHAGHNCTVGNRVIIANCVLLAGHVRVGDRAFVSGGAVVQQFSRIGRVAMISGNSRITADVPPFTLVAERNELYGLNLVGLKRAGISAETIAELKRLYRLFFLAGLNNSQALAEASKPSAFTTPEAAEFIEFVRTSEIGICTPPHKA